MSRGGIFILGRNHCFMQELHTETGDLPQYIFHTLVVHPVFLFLTGPSLSVILYVGYPTYSIVEDALWKELSGNTTQNWIQKKG